MAATRRLTSGAKLQVFDQTRLGHQSLLAIGDLDGIYEWPQVYTEIRTSPSCFLAQFQEPGGGRGDDDRDREEPRENQFELVGTA